MSVSRFSWPLWGHITASGFVDAEGESGTKYEMRVAAYPTPNHDEGHNPDPSSPRTLHQNNEAPPCSYI